MMSQSVGVGYLETLFPPQPSHSLVIDLPAFNAEQLGNLPVAIAAILLCQSDQSQPKAVIISRRCLIALCGPCHADRSASPPLKPKLGRALAHRLKGPVSNFRHHKMEIAGCRMIVIDKVLLLDVAVPMIDDR